MLESRELRTGPMVYSVKDAASSLSIGRTRLYELIDGGQIKAVKLGRRTVIRSEEINRFLGDLPAMKVRSSY